MAVVPNLRVTLEFIPTICGTAPEGVTLIVQSADLPAADAVIVALPCFSAVTTPPSTEATAESEVVHTTFSSVPVTVAVSVTCS